MGIYVRDGEIKDLEFVKELAIDMAKFSVPETRFITPDLINAKVAKVVSSLALEIPGNSNLHILIAETNSKEKVGYLILILNQIEDTTGEPQAYVADIAVKQEYWGKYVWKYLVKEAEKIAKDKGFSYLAGTVSANNPRMLKALIKFLGYQIERHQLVKRLS